jgi:REP element-mobilizing transposase RayT
MVLGGAGVYACHQISYKRTALAAKVRVACPLRGRTGESTYFITADAYQKLHLLQSERAALLLIDVLLHYRKQQKYLLHEFVAMPHHIHVLLTPTGITIERAVGLIKGGFSFRRTRELSLNGEIWLTSFHDWRVRDAEGYEGYRTYIHQNPVKAGLCKTPPEFPYSSAAESFPSDPIPQRLKPID